MIIDKVAPYWTEEDRQRFEKIKVKQSELLLAVQKERQEKGDAISASFLEEWGKLDEAENQIFGEIENRYIRSHSKKAILKDVEEIVSAIEREEFKTRIADIVAQLASLQAEGADETHLSLLREYSIENYENCYRFFLQYLRVQLNAFANDEAYAEKARAIVDRRVSLWYVKENPSYLPMVHGKATDAMADMARSRLEINDLADTASITRNGVRLTFKNLNINSIGVSAHKLLSKAMAEFTRINHTGHWKQKDLKFLRVSFPLKEYALNCGYDVIEHPTATPEEAEKEANRAKSAIDNARNKVKKDFAILKEAELSWEEIVQGKLEKFGDFGWARPIGSGEVKKGQIEIEFTLKFAEYLIRLPITQYPVALLKLDERNNNAYSMGLAIAEHYNQDNNQIRGTAHLLKVKTLLKHSNFPSIEDVRKQRKSWEERIKDPFEKALDSLVDCGLLVENGWRYSKSKGVELTDAEANFTTYEDWEEALIHFTLKDAPDQTARIEARQEEKKARQERQRKTTKKKNP